jgi:biopolymer transport protein ExbD
MARQKTISNLSGINDIQTDLIRPQMTSLIDILTLLLVFLIQSYSAEGNLITPSTDLQLPLSSSEVLPKPALTLEITNTDVIGDNKKLSAISTFSSSESLLIAPVFKWLSHKKAAAASTVIAQKPVIIQCDRAVPFNVVKRVMYTCSKAGFSNFSVLVVEE